jgi:predicted nucleotidyltransferase
MKERESPKANMLALVDRIQPRPGELEAAKRHISVVKDRLDASFDVSRSRQIGSHARGTAVRTYSDIDLLVMLRRNEAQWGGRQVSSTTVLSRVLSDLRARYRDTTIRRDGQAAVVSFAGGSEGLDVVPALFEKFNRLPVFEIPDGFGGWRLTSPEMHDRYFSDADERSGGKLRRVAQLLKWWKHSRSEPVALSSFYTDLLLASSKVCDGIKSYTQCLRDAFALLRARDCRGLQDPCGIAGVVYASGTDGQRQALRNAIEYAWEHACYALSAEARGDFAEANRQWGIVFNGCC